MTAGRPKRPALFCPDVQRNIAGPGRRRACRRRRWPLSGARHRQRKEL